MCWSGEASAALAAVGLGSTTYVAAKGEKKALWMPLGYFSLMELLQAFTYSNVPPESVACLMFIFSQFWYDAIKICMLDNFIGYGFFSMSKE